ncbi:MAG TPA: ExeM/NucH family extracellular endonuclease [Verrucomicrobiales bacterium]|nr:ExeM/NucH family extracellular endonuclease [Verrucomicrobiales bacterium]
MAWCGGWRRLAAGLALGSAGCGAAGGTELEPGDIVVLGWGAEAERKGFVWAPLVGLEPGVELWFTDNGWSGSHLLSGEGLAVFTVGAEGLAAGTVLMGPGSALGNGSSWGPEWSAPAEASGRGIDLAAGGDQILVFTGNPSEPAFLFVLSSAGPAFTAPATADDARRTALPQGLAEGSTAVAAGVDFETGFGNLWYAGDLRRASKAELLASIGDSGFWLGSDDGWIPDLRPLIVEPGYEAGQFVPIHRLHRGADRASWIGREVEIEGVATADLRTRLGGIIVEEERKDWDEDPHTPEGILVLHAQDRPPLRVGDRVRAAGRVLGHARTLALGELRSLVRTGVAEAGEGTVLAFPFPEAAEDWLPRWEAMRVRLEGPLFVADLDRLGRYGQVDLADRERVVAPTQVAAPGSPEFLLLAKAQRHGLVRVDDGRSQEDPRPLPFTNGGLTAIRAGDRWPPFTAVVLRDSGRHVLVPLEEELRSLPGQGRPAGPPPVGGALRVLFLNVAHYFNGDGLGGGFPTMGAWSQAEWERQTAKVVALLKESEAQVMALAELENDAGEGSGALAQLASALDEACGRLSRFKAIAVHMDEAGFSSIANGLIYDSLALRPVGRRAVLRRGVFGAHSRAPLFQVFEETSSGRRFGVVVNHFRSRLAGGNPGPGDSDVGDGADWWNEVRVRSAGELAGWIAQDPVGLGVRDVLIVGDLNAYALEEPLELLRARGYTDLIRTFGGEEVYTYIHEGRAGVLDHALSSAALVSAVTGAAPWSVNAAEGTWMDYRIRYKDGDMLRESADHPFRSSDHDPVLFGLDLSRGGFDGDGDGVSDVEEAVAGTDPEDGEDYLRWAIQRLDDGEIEIGFQARGGRVYTVEYSGDLHGWNVLKEWPAERASQWRTFRWAPLRSSPGFLRLRVRLERR